MTLRVLHISSAITWRGGEQQIDYLLSGLAKRGVQNIVFCPLNSALFKHCQKKNISVFEYRKRNLDPRIAWRINQLSNKFQIDIIHLHDSHAHTFGVMAASLFGCKTPMVLSRRVDFPISKSPLSRWKYNHPQIKKILCVSRCILEILSPDIRHGEKLMVVYSGVDPNRMESPSGILRSEFPFIGMRPIIANIASIAPHKDYFTFVDTVADFTIEYGDQAAQFMIIGGDGGEMHAIQSYIHSKGLQDQIIFTGFRSDIPKIIAELDLLLITSKTEGLCTTIIDAFNASVPVVATKAGGIPELITNERNGLLADIKDGKRLSQQCHRVLSDSELRQSLIEEAKVKAKKFTADQMAANTLACYSSSLG